MLPLRFPRTWLTLGWIFVALALWACLAPNGVPGTAGLNDKTMHALGYLALTTWFTGIYPRSRYLLIATLLLAMGIAIEIAQGAMNMGRAAELRDVYADLVGILVGIACALALMGGWVARIESWLLKP